MGLGIGKGWLCCALEVRLVAGASQKFALGIVKRELLTEKLHMQGPDVDRAVSTVATSMHRRARVARIRKGKPVGAQRAVPSIWILQWYACSMEEQRVSRGGTGPSSALGWPRQEGRGVVNCRVEGDLCSF